MGERAAGGLLSWASPALVGGSSEGILGDSLLDFTKGARGRPQQSSTVSAS